MQRKRQNWLIFVALLGWTRSTCICSGVVRMWRVWWYMNQFSTCCQWWLDWSSCSHPAEKAVTIIPISSLMDNRWRHRGLPQKSQIDLTLRLKCWPFGIFGYILFHKPCGFLLLFKCIQRKHGFTLVHWLWPVCSVALNKCFSHCSSKPTHLPWMTAW